MCFVYCDIHIRLTTFDILVEDILFVISQFVQHIIVLMCRKERKLLRELELSKDRSTQQEEDLEKQHNTRKQLRAALDDLEMRLHDEKIVRQAAVQHAADLERSHNAQVLSGMWC